MSGHRPPRQCRHRRRRTEAYATAPDVRTGRCARWPVTSLDRCPHACPTRTRAPRTRPGRCGTSGGWSAASRGGCCGAALFGTVWMVGLAVRPYLIARAIDDGLRAARPGALLGWVAAIVVAGVALAWLGIMRHRTMTFVREDASARSAGRAAAARWPGSARRCPASSPPVRSPPSAAPTSCDASQVLTMTGPGVGAVLAYAVVAVVLLVDRRRCWPLVVAARRAGDRRARRAAAAPAGAGRVGLPAAAGRADRPGRSTSSAGLRVLNGLGGTDLFARRTPPGRSDAAGRGVPGRRGDQLDRRARRRSPRAVPGGRGLARGPDGRRGRDHHRATGRRLRVRRDARRAGLRS